MPLSENDKKVISERAAGLADIVINQNLSSIEDSLKGASLERVFETIGHRNMVEIISFFNEELSKAKLNAVDKKVKESREFISMMAKSMLR